MGSPMGFLYWSFWGLLITCLDVVGSLLKHYLKGVIRDNCASVLWLGGRAEKRDNITVF